MKIFDVDGPLMIFLGRLADIMWLNILTILCCIPVVTAGASITAMHYVCLKMARDEEGYITKDFFKSFKLNFKQATLLWLIMLAIIVVLAGDYYVINSEESGMGTFMKAAIMLVTILISITAVMVYPLLARFKNSVIKTIKNAFFVSMLQFPRTILMIILTVLPAFLLWLFGLRLLPLIFLFGLAGPAFLCAKLYNKTFRMLEERFLSQQPEEGEEESEDEEDVRIFKDELDESLQDENPQG